MVHRPTPEQRRPGRPNLISREIIADTAIGLIAEAGVDALTFQSLAARLGVKHPALYRHVDGRSDLLRAVADRFMETTEWPEPKGSWQDYLRDVAAAIDAECGRYPGMMDLIYNQVWPMPERLIRAALEMTENLVVFGFPQRLALVAADMVADFAADSRIRRDRIAQYTEQWGGFTEVLGPAPDAPDGAHDAGLRAAFDAHFSAGPDAWVNDKLEIVLAGIEARLATAEAPESHHRRPGAPGARPVGPPGGEQQA